MRKTNVLLLTIVTMVYLKQLILNNITNVHFDRAPLKIKSEQVLITKLKEKIISNASLNENLENHLIILFNAVKILRRDISISSP